MSSQRKRLSGFVLSRLPECRMQIFWPWTLQPRQRFLPLSIFAMTTEAKLLVPRLKRFYGIGSNCVTLVGKYGSWNDLLMPRQVILTGATHEGKSSVSYLYDSQ